MVTLLSTVAIIAIAMIVMALGVMLSGKRLRGSCGGVGTACACEKAGVPPGNRRCQKMA